MIRASPAHPPYSLQLVLERLQDSGLKIFTSTHLHSSVVQKLPANLNDFFPESDIKRSEADLCITLIWKEGKSSDWNKLFIVMHVRCSIEQNMVTVSVYTFLTYLKFKP